MRCTQIIGDGLEPVGPRLHAIDRLAALDNVQRRMSSADLIKGAGITDTVSPCKRLLRRCRRIDIYILQRVIIREDAVIQTLERFGQNDFLNQRNSRCSGNMLDAVFKLHRSDILRCAYAVHTDHAIVSCLARDGYVAVVAGYLIRHERNP